MAMLVATEALTQAQLDNAPRVSLRHVRRALVAASPRFVQAAVSQVEHKFFLAICF